MRIQTQTAISDLVEGAHYWVKLETYAWAVWEFSEGAFEYSNGARYSPDVFERIGPRVYTPEETDAYDRKIARLRGWLSVISVETAYAADTLEDAADTIVTVSQMADMALDGDEVPVAGQLAVGERAAARDVLAERKRQQAVEGWTPEHDDQYTDGQLALAACAYIEGNPVWWPADFDPDMLKLSTDRRNLEKGLALGLAELERIDRAAERAKGGAT